MRRLGYLLLCALLLAVLVPLLSRLLPALDPASFMRSASEAWKLELADQAVVSLAYEVTPQGVTFPLPPGTQRVKLITHARFPQLERLRRQQAGDPTRRWGYALEITLLGVDGTVVLRREQHFRSNVTEWLDAAGRQVTAAYFLDDSATPSNGSLLHLDLAGLPPVASLRLRRLSADPEADGVLARAYTPELIPERRLDTLWQRLHEGQKVRLARGSVYAHELLLEEERRNLLRNLWQPVAPRGARGIDFTVRELYVLREIDGERVEPPIAPAGLSFGPRLRAMVPIPEEGGRYRFEFSALEPHPGAAEVRLDWYGPGVFDERRLLATGNGARFEWSGTLAGGLVEVASEHEFALRVFLLGSPDLEVTPQQLYERSYLASAEQSVDFALAHQGADPTPLRLTLRQLVQPASAPAARARYAFLDAADTVIAEGEVALGGEISLYDRVLSEVAGSAVSDPSEVFFLAPRQATRLRLLADTAGAVLVTLHSRPPTLAQRTRVPEDRYEYSLRGGRIPAWFSVRPQDYERRVLEHRSRLLAVQSRPPERNAALLAGNYQWQEYRPEGDWLARALFTARDPEQGFREDALPSTFSPLPSAHPVTLRVPAYHGQQAVTPTLVWLADGAAASELQITVQVDDQPPQLLRGRGAFGQAQLRPVDVGSHRLRIDAPAGVRCYLNHVAPLSGARSQRLALRLDGPLRFEYQRATRAQEFLTARLFQAGASQPRRAQLAIRVTGPTVPLLTPLDHWLFDQRVGDVRADDSDRSTVFNTEGQQVDAGQPVFIPFPEGTPPGRYRVDIAAVPGSASGELYLALSRVAATPEARERLHFEPMVSHASP